MSCKLSVVADPNSKVYERLTAEEIDTLLSRRRWREFASNLLVRGFVVFKKRSAADMVYVLRLNRTALKLRYRIVVVRHRLTHTEREREQAT
jgi:hypothetical protein